MTLTGKMLQDLVNAALAEDAPWGDVTTQALVSTRSRARAALVAREAGVMSGGAVFDAVFRALDRSTMSELEVADGDRFEAGQRLAAVEGASRDVLQGERVALNLIQRMCGIATLTQRFVEAVSHTKARIVDTRKTTPGLRALERQAVRDGGGRNHRYSLSDAVLVKDNHLVLLAQESRDIVSALQTMKASLPHTVHVEVEVDRLDQVEDMVRAGADTLLLDNFCVQDLRTAVKLIDGRAQTEASGNVNLDSVVEIAETGVDLISVGALTHSVRSLDLGLDVVAYS